MRSPIALACLLATASVGCVESPDGNNVDRGRLPVGPTSGFSWVVGDELAGMAQPGSSRSLEEDLAYLDSQQIRRLVSLTEVPTDPAVLEAWGIEAVHIPVPDFTAPSLLQMFTLVAVVRASMRSGEVIGIHCGAGLGRTGTMLAAYFISEGMSAAEAIEEIRRLRPGSVETDSQEQRLAEFAAAYAE